MDKATAKAEWLRAKWARERAERAEQRLTEKSAPADEIKAAKALLRERTKVEKDTRKVYDAAMKQAMANQSVEPGAPVK